MPVQHPNIQSDSYALRVFDLRLPYQVPTLKLTSTHFSPPTGKADTLSETAFQTARREACEEIGLPNITQPLPPPFSVEHLCELPANLAKTELVVRPCVALLHSFDPVTGTNADPETELIPRLDAREVAAVFTARFDDFLRLRNSEGRGEGDWYRGSWSLWHNSNWRSKSIFHFFFIISSLVFLEFMTPS